MPFAYDKDWVQCVLNTINNQNDGDNTNENVSPETLNQLLGKFLVESAWVRPVMGEDRIRPDPHEPESHVNKVQLQY